MNRRQFLKRTTGAIAGLLVFGPMFRRFDNFGIARESIIGQAVRVTAQEEREEIRRIAQSLDDGESITARLECYPGYCPAGIDDGGATRRRMERILADNPEMRREDAFLQAMLETVEGSICER